ncbi:hypothetical protein SeV_A1398 [Salmonella enterica subsp. enterica serovar Virchow str. SL491]|nr:hypothetical protein SeV_A1398 [Salmonella enterica subsp. enterica serovar Virchow str. SL491]
MSKQERHRNKPYTDGKQFYASFNEALLALLTRKKVNIHNVF